MSKPTKLLLALKNAKKHLEITTNQASSNNQTTDLELTTQPKSKLNRLTLTNCELYINRESYPLCFVIHSLHS